jgi:minimal PKS acyl carrier protein
LRQITLSELQDIMRECAGEDEDPLPLEQAADQPFGELGYDSLALLETQSRIKRDLGVEIPEDEFDAASTMRELVDVVNARLGVS